MKDTTVSQPLRDMHCQTDIDLVILVELRAAAVTFLQTCRTLLRCRRYHHPGFSGLVSLILDQRRRFHESTIQGVVSKRLE